MGDGIEFRLDRPERVLPVPSGRENASEVVFRLYSLLLDVVKTVVVCLPYVDGGAFDGVSVSVGDSPRHKHGLALRILADVRAHFILRRSFQVKWPEHRALGRADLRSGFVIDCIDKHGNPEAVGEEDELLPPVVAHVSGGGEKLYALDPFLLGQLHVLDEAVGVSHERVNDLRQTRVLRVGVAAGHHFRGSVFREVQGAVSLIFSRGAPSVPRMLKNGLDILPCKRPGIRTRPFHGNCGCFLHRVLGEAKLS
mmetsp:Transcript_24147/g.45157  ORF Transcript_24147/g.45157 Transcript_24147/m.45157 type:complete len:253 (+) Transcript_24147:337-1095(+)